MTDPRLLLSPPDGVALSDTELFDASAAELLVSVVEEELSRYPADTAVPKMLLCRRAAIDGAAVGAWYVAEYDLGILTPRLDLRGNVHRIVAASLLEKNPTEATNLKDRLETAGTVQLYGGALDISSELVALVAATIVNRLSGPNGYSTQIVTPDVLTAIEGFLERFGLGRGRRATAPVAEYAYFTAMSGEYPAYRIDPGGVEVSFVPGESDGSVAKDAVELVAPSDAGGVARALVKDLWIYPEQLFGEITKILYVVEDLRSRQVDVAGYASGHDQSASTVVIERKGRRRILFHELGHAIHFRYSDLFPDAKWDQLAKPSDYFGDAVEFIKLGVYDADYGSELLGKGFITSYSTANKKEDVAELTEAVFVGDERLWANLPNAPVVAAKVHLLMEFWEQINPMLTEGYLRSLASERHVQERRWGIG